jgi:hypothetical protein
VRSMIIAMLLAVAFLAFFGCDNEEASGPSDFPDQFDQAQLSLNGSYTLNTPVTIPDGVLLTMSGASLALSGSGSLTIQGTLQMNDCEITGSASENISSVIHLDRADSLCSFRSCTFRRGYVALSSYHSNFLVEQCTFRQQYRAGIEVNGDEESVIRTSTFADMVQVSDAGYGAILVSCDSTRFEQNVVNNCVVGVYVMLSDALLFDNEISQCGLYGIEVNEDGHASIMNNYIHGCNNYALVIRGVSAPAQPILAGNTIQDNQAGVWLRYWNRYDNSIHGNNFIDNVEFSLGYTEDSDYPYSVFTPSDVTDNYWGSVDEDVIATMIRDGIDGLPVDTLEFRPFATSPFTP